MSYYRESVQLEVSVSVDVDLETDQNGTLYVVSIVSSGDDEYGKETKVPLEEVVENIIEFYETADGCQPLYTMAHELARMAERLRSTANLLEGKLTFEDDLDDYPDDEPLER